MVVSVASNIIIPRLMNKIIDRIYIGAYHAAQDLDYRNEHGITHILNCTPDPHVGLKSFQVRQININDGNEIPRDELMFAVATITAAVQQGGKILVHCHAGISRSPGIVCAYLMSIGFSWDEALDIVRRARPQAYPHPNIERSIKKILGQTINLNNTLLGGNND
jgi:dual specificity phosphatase 12